MNALVYVDIQHYCTGQRKRASISAPIILSKLLGPASVLLASSSSLEIIIGAEILALFLASAVMLNVPLGKNIKLHEMKNGKSNYGFSCI